MYKLACGTTCKWMFKSSSILTLSSVWMPPATNVFCLLNIHKKGIDLGSGELKIE